MHCLVVGRGSPCYNCRRRIAPCPREKSVIESLLYQSQQAGLPVGERDWLLAVIGAIAVELPPLAPEPALPRKARREAIELHLLEGGLAYGTSAGDPAVHLQPDASPGEKAFVALVAGILRTCAETATLSGSPWFSSSASQGVPANGAQARRVQLLALLAAAGDERKVAATMFNQPLEATPAVVQRMAGKVAVRLSRRYLAEGIPFAGLPLHNGLCAIEARNCATLALAAFSSGRLSQAGCHLANQAALAWRAVLVELLGGLAAAQDKGQDSRRSFDQVLRDQRLPAREARLLRRALADPRSPEQVGAALGSPVLRKFAVTHVLLAALVDRHFDAGEVSFVERLGAALGIDAGELAALEVAVGDFYRRSTDALAALRRAEIPERLPRAFGSRVQAAVVDNLDRLLQEIRETGELAELLTKAAGGATLTAEEKAKVREQLIDLAKSIPALAVFAAPMGTLLLPILIKVLPFNLLPSSFSDEGPRLALPPRRDARSLPPPAKP